MVCYELARQGSVFYLLPDSGYLRIKGEDRYFFLQRQTTNDVYLLKPGLTIMTVLTSSAARILDVLSLFDQTDGIGVLTMPGYGEKTSRYLKSRVFFMDKVEVNDASADFSQVDLFGPQAGSTLRLLGVDRLPERSETVVARSTWGEVRILSEGASIGLGYRLLFSTEYSSRFQEALVSAGAGQLDQESYHLLRVEGGMPASGHELSEDFTPLEIGLHDVVSDHKGCYTGQEVIARQITYDKVTQRLCGIRLDHPVKAGDRLWAEGKPVGIVTSFVVSPRFGAIALAVLKRPHDQPDTRLTVGEVADFDNQAVVINLPFENYHDRS